MHAGGRAFSPVSPSLTLGRSHWKGTCFMATALTSSIQDANQGKFHENLVAIQICSMLVSWVFKEWMDGA